MPYAITLSRNVMKNIAAKSSTELYFADRSAVMKRQNVSVTANALVDGFILLGLALLA